MAYCNTSDVLEMIKGDLYNTILGDEYIEDSAIREKKMLPLVASAIEDADAEINGYISKRYKLLPPSPSAVLHKFSKDIAVYNLISRIGIDESERDKTFLNRYNAAIKFLTLVADGKVEIGITTPAKESSRGFQMASNRRKFTRNSMRGW